MALGNVAVLGLCLWVKTASSYWETLTVIGQKRNEEKIVKSHYLVKESGIRARTCLSGSICPVTSLQCATSPPCAL